ncbi:hypothetical protein COY20_00570 [Candidatus Shapirobacteria bacterium CG_4_10_14_0_2_um_filter_40_12]|uniref:Uncharacterized protein n=1 Tax=Candidatus Shapirobacteria bacterium CG_4_10_14_0_2_um_filter_40_12 TaxID=1974871 RepID=A0A2M7TU34_9BACT|nr:MAG: hypothetical protein COY20_00570 [Candidatus Shapirobacteria bacterium CG_4_10_14_0_2_um_filter_40_12]
MCYTNKAAEKTEVIYANVCGQGPDIAQKVCGEDTGYAVKIWPVRNDYDRGELWGNPLFLHSRHQAGTCWRSLLVYP